MKNSKSWILAAAALTGAVALLAACGGGGDDTPGPASQVPATASQSVGGWIGYLQALIASPNTDGLSPVDTTQVAGPTDETSSPSVVD